MVSVSQYNIRHTSYTGDDDELDEGSKEYRELVDNTLIDRETKDSSSLPVTHSTFIARLSFINVSDAKKDRTWDELYQKYNPYLISSKDHVSVFRPGGTSPFLLHNTNGIPRFRIRPGRFNLIGRTTSTIQ